MARKIERARPLPWLQARGRRLDLGQALLLALDELARSRVLARDLSHHRHVGIGIALGAGANAEHLEADAIESLDRIAADGRPLKDASGFRERIDSMFGVNPAPWVTLVGMPSTLGNMRDRIPSRIAAADDGFMPTMCRSVPSIAR